MGYYCNTDDVEFYINKDKHDAAKKALVTALDGNSGRYNLSNLAGVITDLMMNDGEVYTDEAGNINGMWCSGKWSWISRILQILAPFVDDGSYITFLGEDDVAWKVSFDGGHMYEQEAKPREYYDEKAMIV